MFVFKSSTRHIYLASCVCFLRLVRTSASEDFLNIKKRDASGQMAAVPRKPGTHLRYDTSDGIFLSQTLGAAFAKVVRREGAVLPFVLW